jgi:glucose-6-phosphate isomerase
MESNGKSLDRDGRAVNYATGPMIWGGLGNQGQHSYFQLLCQGTHRIAVDMISVDNLDRETEQMCRAHEHVFRHGVLRVQEPNAYIPGNIPVNHIRLQDVSPSSIGALIALYEHKIYIQSVIWNINAFDQPGVESFKQEMSVFKEELVVSE